MKYRINGIEYRTLPLDPDVFDRYVAATPDLIGFPAYHRGDDEGTVWPKPDVYVLAALTNPE